MCSNMIAACLSLIFRPVTTEQVMYVKEDLIIPQVRTIYWSLEGGGRKNGVRLVILQVKTRNSEAQTLPMIQKKLCLGISHSLVSIWAARMQGTSIACSVFS